MIPLKRVTSPRLELAAAVVATKRTGVICQDVDFAFNKAHFWIITSVALHCIRNSSCRFLPFVANHVDLTCRLCRRYPQALQSGIENIGLAGFTHRVLV